MEVSFRTHGCDLEVGIGGNTSACEWNLLQNFGTLTNGNINIFCYLSGLRNKWLRVHLVRNRNRNTLEIKMVISSDMLVSESE